MGLWDAIMTRPRKCYVCLEAVTTNEQMPMCDRHKPALIEQKPAPAIALPSDADYASWFVPGYGPKT